METKQITHTELLFQSLSTSSLCLLIRLCFLSLAPWTHPFKTGALSHARLFTTILMWRFGRLTVWVRESDPNRSVLLWHNYLLTLTSIPPSFPLYLCLFSIAPSLLLRSNIIWVQLTFLKSPGCFKRCELEGIQTQGDGEEVGETGGRWLRWRQWKNGEEGNEKRQNESQCHQCCVERGVFDLTNRDSKTLQLALLLAELSLYCTL